MANTVTLIDKKRAVSNRIVYVFQILCTGNYATSTTQGVAGETIDFNGASNPKKIARPKLPGAPAGVLPPNTSITVARCPDGFGATIEQNAVSPTPSNYVLRIFTSGNSSTGNSAYPAAWLADTAGVIVEITVPMKYA